jgi:hypothetical protein
MIWDKIKTSTTFTTIAQHRSASLRQSNQARERNKGHTNWKTRSQLSLLANGMTIHIEKSQRSHQKNY